MYYMATSRILLCAAMTAFSVLPVAGQSASTLGSTPNQQVKGAETPGGGTAVAPTPAPRPDSEQASNIEEIFTKGSFYGYYRLLYYRSDNAFFTSGRNQRTATDGTELAYKSASFYGFSAGIGGFLQRGIDHSAIPSAVDTYLGPNVTSLGLAYLNYEHEKFKVVVGNQRIDVPFASDYDYRIVPALFQGIYARYGDSQNYVTAFNMDRYKSWIDSSFTKNTNYNMRIDAFSGVGTRQTSGFWGAGAVGHKPLGGVVLSGQAWFENYQDYARLGYVEGQVIKREGEIKPYLGLQFFAEGGSGANYLGRVDSQTYGAQLGVKYGMLNANVNYDRVTPHASAYNYGSIVAPYAHNQVSGPIFAQPLLTSTEDLGAGNAYSFDLKASVTRQVLVGLRYSYMDLKTGPSIANIKQSEYLGYAVLDLSSYVKGFRLADFIALETRATSAKTFLQNRIAFEYRWVL